MSQDYGRGAGHDQINVPEDHITQSQRADSAALDAIRQLLDGRAWDSDTVDEVSRLVRATGRSINPPDMGRYEFFCPNGCVGTFRVHVHLPMQIMNADGVLTEELDAEGMFNNMDDSEMLECGKCGVRLPCRDFRAAEQARQAKLGIGSEGPF